MILMASCSTVPVLRVQRPWTRSLRSYEDISINSKISIDVNGVSLPLLGDDKLVSSEIKKSLLTLLLRRGFKYSSDSYDYLVSLNYKTEKDNKMMISSSLESINYYKNYRGSFATSYGLGVSIAKSIGALSVKSNTISRQIAEETTFYINTIAINISKPNKTQVWKGELIWDSSSPNILNQILPNLQLILCDLPSNQTIRPEVNEIKESHINYYYNIECNNKWFTCPALPYRIYLSPKTYITNRSSQVPNYIEDSFALDAYVDLIQTAEYAIPKGNEEDWEDPLDNMIWSDVTLGGQYVLNPSKKRINIILTLKGETEGYYLKNARVVDNSEYSIFQTKYRSWHKTLTNYYDYYVR